MRAASAIEIKQPFQRIRFGVQTLLDYRTDDDSESMIDMASKNRITKVSRVFLRV
jgi:hypothetical protein